MGCSGAPCRITPNPMLVRYITSPAASPPGECILLPAHQRGASRTPVAPGTSHQATRAELLLRTGQASAINTAVSHPSIAPSSPLPDHSRTTPNTPPRQCSEQRPPRLSSALPPPSRPVLSRRPPGPWLRATLELPALPAARGKFAFLSPPSPPGSN